jgi:hypothetical protein
MKTTHWTLILVLFASPVVVTFAGCSGQDASQPPVGSISAGDKNPVDLPIMKNAPKGKLPAKKK